MRISDWSSDLCSSDLFIVVSVEDRLRRRSLFQEPLAPGRSAEIGERRIIGIAAVVDPGLESVSALLLESGLKLLAIFQGPDAPAAGRENLVEAAAHPLGRRRVQRLAVIVDDPPPIADVLLVGLDQAFVEDRKSGGSGQ